jgi:hypothetical protein
MGKLNKKYLLEKDKMLEKTMMSLSLSIQHCPGVSQCSKAGK